MRLFGKVHARSHQHVKALARAAPGEPSIILGKSRTASLSVSEREAIAHSRRFSHGCCLEPIVQLFPMRSIAPCRRGRHWTLGGSGWAFSPIPGRKPQRYVTCHQWYDYEEYPLVTMPFTVPLMANQSVSECHGRVWRPRSRSLPFALIGYAPHDVAPLQMVGFASHHDVQAPRTTGGISNLIRRVQPRSPDKHPPHQPVIARKTRRIIVRTVRSRAIAIMWANGRSLRAQDQ
jgi:hypothetical protein